MQLIIPTIVLFVTPLVFAQSRPSSTIPLSDYVANEIIVKYKPNLTPQDLKLTVQKRKERRSTFLGKLMVMVENFRLGLNKKDTPEEHLTRLQSTDKTIGVLQKKLLYTQKASTDKNLYLLKLDGTTSVTQAVESYNKLPEVEYAEPNYIYTIF